jgi:hypothetical protein
MRFENELMRISPKPLHTYPWYLWPFFWDQRRSNPVAKSVDLNAIVSEYYADLYRFALASGIILPGRPLI